MGAALGNGGGRSGRHRALAEINITPLVDVMLVLLIISMLAAPTSAPPAEDPMDHVGAELVHARLEQPELPHEVVVADQRRNRGG